MSETGLSIIVPIYNEEEGLRQTLREMESFLGEGNIEVLLVNDGSDAKTKVILDEIKQDGIIVIDHPVNRGYGASLKTGIANSRYDYVAITDADGTYPNERIPEFERLARKNDLDMVVGARKGETVNIPWIRRFPKWCIGQLAEYVAKSRIPDLNSGLRLMRKETVNRYLEILPDGFSFTSTITLATTINKHKVEFVNINYYKRIGFSKISPIADTLNFLNLISKIMVHFDRKRIFTPVGMLLLIIGKTAGILRASIVKSTKTT
jgi:glycosyltransferase involved in cell wall biosynthesis